MKILIVSVDFPPHTDGVSTVAHELATRLSDAGEEIIVIGPSSKDDRKYDSRQSFRVIRTPLYEFGYLRFIPIFFVMPYIILRYRIKTVIAMNIAYGGIISYLFFRLLGFQYCLWAYGYEFSKFENNRFMRRLYQKIYEHSLFVAAITNFVRGRLIIFGVQPEKIVIIKPGADPQRYRPIKVEDEFIKRYNLQNKKVILSVGRLIERKGVDMAIRALREVLKKYPQTVYLLVGQGPFKERLEALAVESGVRESVRFAGRVPDEDLLKFYNICDLFIMPSRTLDDKGDIEGFGIVFLEAGSCEKPVIGGLDGGMAEAVENGVTGLLVNSFDTEAISCAIIKLLSDKGFAASLGKNGRRRVLEELNWGRAVSSFQGYLKIKTGVPIA